LRPKLKPYKGKLDKKIAVGFISHRALQVETAEDVRLALKYIEPEHLIHSSDCGFGRQGVPRPIALYKAAAMAQGANIVRAELGADTTAVPAADPALQIDVPEALAEVTAYRSRRTLRYA
jgi:5-methyltetrahydropteroyltriglutamate--homocysteine methyltransferase